METLPKKKYEAAVFGPLREFDNLKLEPDGILICANSCQTYLLVKCFVTFGGLLIE